MGDKDSVLIPLAIVIAGIIIAGAVYTSKKGDVGTPNTGNDKEAVAEIDLAPVTSEDHILGSYGADIIIVEYSDTECSFCKKFHETMNQIIDEYAKDGKVAWVYRHYPIDSIHPKSRKEAEATECAADLGGNIAFWEYINRLFEITPSNNGLDLNVLPDIAEEIGIDRSSFQECLDSGRNADKVENLFQTGLTAGVRGTPHSIVITTKDGEKTVLQGAQPYITVKQLIETKLAQTEN